MRAGSLDRQIFENALSKMKTYGIDVLLISPKISKKRDSIKKSLLKYYEETEEFEKCIFIKNFFEELEIKIASISETEFG
jgi:hypothetical protein